MVNLRSRSGGAFSGRKICLASLIVVCYLLSPNRIHAQAEMNTAAIEIGKTYNVDWINGTVKQILDDEHLHVALCYARTGQGRIEVIIRVKSTKGMTDPMAIPCTRWKHIIGSNVLKCEDTKRVKLTDGSRKTMYLLTPVLK